MSVFEELAPGSEVSFDGMIAKFPEHSVYTVKSQTLRPCTVPSLFSLSHRSYLHCLQEIEDCLLIYIFCNFLSSNLGELEFLYWLNFIFVLTSLLLVCLVSFLIHLVMLTRHGPRPYTYSLRWYIRTCHYAPTWNILKSRHWTKNWLKCLLF